MQTRTRKTFTTIHSEGALLPADLLQRISENDKSLGGLDPESYYLAPGEKINEAINRSWNRLNGLWGAFKTSRSRLGPTDAGTTLTRERWLLPLFQELGYGRLSTTKAVEIEGRSYPISHRRQNVPLHLVGCGLELDKRTPGAAGAARVSPHSLMQEYLNRTDDTLWGLVSNGLGLRVLRDNAALTRQAYLEFDLEAMFEGEIYSDFVLLWLACHQSRLETGEKGKECWLERWSKSAQEQGTRALDDLRRGVEEAIASLGQGFLQHPLNQDLRSRLKQGELAAQDYYRQLLRLVYRLIFLFTAEDRDLLLLPDAPTEARQRYQKYYSTSRLRSLAERQRGSRHHDRYEALQLVMSLLSSNQGCPELALPALGGFLFEPGSTADLNKSRLDNQALLAAVRSLAFIVENNTRRAVDYRNLGPEELGSVYEALLELHPRINTEAGSFELSSAAGNERKTTGSYYTPSSLIQVLLDSALDPVIEDRLKGKADAAQQEQALLDLKVCDPACGSGHFLIAAAHRIAGRLAQARAGGDEPPPNETRRALRDVIRHCIYGVDINPMAVELCKVNLWLESIEPGKPLPFLKAHVQCGDSLVGVGPGMDITEIPDEAFKPAFGDDKTTASVLRKRNKRERTGQLGFRWEVTELTNADDLARWRAERAGQVDAMPEDEPAQIRAKAQAFEDYQQTQEYIQNRLEYDLWTAAFFWPMRKGDAEHILAPTQQELITLKAGSQPDVRLLFQVRQIAQDLNFFHWELAFPQVFSGKTPGFDCVLGNPPWEMLQLEEQEFFAAKDPEIVRLPGEQRKRAIQNLHKNNPSLARDFENAKHLADARNKFIRESKRYKLTALGKMNTYALFAEHFRSLMSAQGRAGIIVPTGIATDDTTKEFFGDLVEKRAIASLFDFENREKLFPAVDSRMKFCLLTLSGAAISNAKFVFFATRTEHLYDERRRFTLDPSEIALFNPNTRTMPVFRTRMDAELTRKVYQRVPVLVNEQTGENPWGVSFKQGLFNMTSDSGMFITEPREGYVRLYEAKMFWHYDHRWSTYEGEETRDVSSMEKKDPLMTVRPRYWISERDVSQRLQSYQRGWLIAFRNITNATNERTAIFTFIPKIGVGNSAPLLLFDQVNALFAIALNGNLSSLVFDFSCRYKVGGTNINFFIVKQLPVLPPTSYTSVDISFIIPRVVELVYTAWDLAPFALDVLDEVDPVTWSEWFPHNPIPHATIANHNSPPAPFSWDEERRALLRAELDAYYAKLYGLTRDELRYILDPQDVYGPDFPGETFRVLKEKEIKQFGEYRTRRLVLEAWDRLEGVERVEPFVQPLQPATSLPVELETRRGIPDITWIPRTPGGTEKKKEKLTPTFRQAVGVAWLLENFGTGQSILIFDANKYAYFIQQKKLADLDIPFMEAARGPYSSQLTYHAGAYAMKKRYWEVKGDRVAKGRNMKEALGAASRVFTDLEQARQLTERLAKMSKDDLGRLATVDFTGRALFDRSQVITPNNIRAYFQSDWPAKLDDPWYTDENIHGAMEMLSDLGLFEKAEPAEAQSLEIDELNSETISQPMASQAMLTDFGLYKCEACGKMVMGFEKEKHLYEKHVGRPLKWKRIRGN